MALASDNAQETNLGRYLQGLLHNPQKSATTYRGQEEKESEPRAKVRKQNPERWFCVTNSRQAWESEIWDSLLRYYLKKEKKKKVDRWDGEREGEIKEGEGKQFREDV